MNDRFLTKEESQAYQVLCSFLAWALYSDFDEEAFAAFSGEAQSFSAEPFSSVAPEEGSVLCEVFMQARENGTQVWQDVHQDRSYLFYMVGASHTSPYESVYRTDDGTLFGPTTLEVREAYRACGLEYPDSKTNPDDHMGLEMSFASVLLGRAAGGDGLAIERLRDFLANHTLVFADVYFENLGMQARSDFYRAVAGLGRKTMSSLASALRIKAQEPVKNNPLAL